MKTLPANTMHALTALANSIQEICGYILQDGTIVIMPNVSDRPMDSFRANPVNQAAFLSNMHGEVRSMFHTHPRGVCWPSEEDVENWPPAAKEGGVSYLIVTTREVGEFRLDEDGKPKPVE